MKIVYLGAGNVAWHLAQAFDEKVSVVQVFSRSFESAKSLCSMLKNSEPICDMADLRCDADVYIVSVADVALQEVLCRVPRHCREKLWLHTSGGCGIEVFPDDFCSCGVLYPLQTFTKGSKLCISDIPFFIEARNPEQTEKIRNLALMLTDKVYEADSERRRTLHIAAVFACNFTNYLYSLSHDILKTADLPFSVMLPLIRATVGKIEQMPPEKAQTGPAARGDRNVIEAHLATLKDPLQKELYEIFSEEILKKSLQMSRINYDLSKIKGIAFDVDGVLSPSMIPLHIEGEPMRMVNIKDGYALQLAVKKGLKIAIITGGNTKSVRMRYEGLGIKDVYMGVAIKIDVFNQWMSERGLHPEEVAFVGDDIPDFQAMKRAGLAVAPADAAPEIKDIAGYISPCLGGHGVARDLLEQVMKVNGTWFADDTAFGW